MIRIRIELNIIIKTDPSTSRQLNFTVFRLPDDIPQPNWWKILFQIPACNR